MTYDDAKRNLFVNYSKYGITESAIDDAMKDGIENYGLSVDAVYNGLRMALSLTIANDEHEYFSIEDVMSITGETREEATKRVEDMLKEIEEKGGNPDDYAVKNQQDDRKVFYFPNGINTKEKE